MAGRGHDYSPVDQRNKLYQEANLKLRIQNFFRLQSLQIWNTNIFIAMLRVSSTACFNSVVSRRFRKHVFLLFQLCGATRVPVWYQGCSELLFPMHLFGRPVAILIAVGKFTGISSRFSYYEYYHELKSGPGTGANRRKNCSAPLFPGKSIKYQGMYGSSCGTRALSNKMFYCIHCEQGEA
eukprot:3153091-Rhodomonas_salina.1